MMRRHWVKLVLSMGFSVTTVLLALAALPARSVVPHLGYGFNVAEWDVGRLQALGFNWIKAVRRAHVAATRVRASSGRGHSADQHQCSAA